MKEKIKKLADDFLPVARIIRRHLHAHPELSMQEKNTSELLQKKLTDLKIPFRAGIAKYGIEAIIKGKNDNGKVVALRADMDALPIFEKNTVDYCSKNEGVMHACGHDVHMTGVLGAAWILMQLKNEFDGTVKLIFQPSEEKNPGGASLMIKENILENPKPDSIFAQHVFPELKAGEVGFFAGKYMASADEIYITVRGKGGHAALPHLNINPLFMAGKLLSAYHDFIKNILEPNEVKTVLSFGNIIGNGATNVVPDEVKIAGTFRAMDDAWRFAVHEKIKTIAETVAKDFGGSIDVLIDVGYPCLENDVALTNQSKKFAEEYLGKENVKELKQRMSSEDFAFYSQIIPSCFYRLGTNSPDGKFSSSVHTPTFDIDEEALRTASGLMAYLAVKQLA